MNPDYHQLELGECVHRWSKPVIVEEHVNIHKVVAAVTKQQTCGDCGAVRQYIDFGVKRGV